MTEYKDYPAVEWILFFENTGKNESPILEDVLPADFTIKSDESGIFTLHHADGSHAIITDFQPIETKMALGMKNQESTMNLR